MDYRVLNNLLPPVTKFHLKAKRFITLVPLLEINKNYLNYLAQKLLHS